MTSSNLERRQTLLPVEMRASDSGQRIGGYAAKFMKESQNLGGFIERIAPGFFDSSRDSAWRGVMARYNHEDLLGTTAAGSLRLMIDSTGLDYEVDLLDDQLSERVHKLVTRGDVQQSSFAFITTEDEWTMSDFGFPLRTLIRGQLVDVAPVDSPAYLDTSTGLRSFAEARGMDLDEVSELARANALGQFLKPQAQIFDLAPIGDRSTVADAITTTLNDLVVTSEAIAEARESDVKPDALIKARAEMLARELADKQSLENAIRDLANKAEQGA